MQILVYIFQQHRQAIRSLQVRAYIIQGQNATSTGWKNLFYINLFDYMWRKSTMYN